MEKRRQKTTAPEGGGGGRPGGRPHSPEMAIARVAGVMDLSESLRCDHMLPEMAIICVADDETGYIGLRLC